MREFVPEVAIFVEIQIRVVWEWNRIQLIDEFRSVVNDIVFTFPHCHTIEFGNFPGVVRRNTFQKFFEHDFAFAHNEIVNIRANDYFLYPNGWEYTTKNYLHIGQNFLDEMGMVSNLFNVFCRKGSHPYYTSASLRHAVLSHIQSNGVIY